MFLSDEQNAAAMHGLGREPTYEWVEAPVGPQPIPAWAKGLTIHWMDGYANEPHFTVKTVDSIRDWPGKVFHRDGDRYLAESGDGRADCYYHRGEPALAELTQWTFCVPVSPPDASGLSDYSKTGRWYGQTGKGWRSTYVGWATPQDRGFGGSDFPIKLDDGRWLILRGPWCGASPPGYTHVGTSSGAAYVSDDVLLLLIARHYAHCRVARVTQYGRTSIQPVREDWDEPKRWMQERASRARRAARTA